jgi:transcription-repair coupling factor (superfamily II helicase)
LLGADAQIVLIDPTRLRTRAEDLLAEEHDIAASLARTWGGDIDVEVAQLHLELEFLLARTDAVVANVTTLADSPEMPTVKASAPAPSAAAGGGSADRQYRGALAASRRGRRRYFSGRSSRSDFRGRDRFGSPHWNG